MILDKKEILAMSVSQQVKFLENFLIEKVRAEDIKVFIEFMEKQMVEKLNMSGCMDICGTGGSGLERINTSTIAAFILAELGVKIAKHGNKAASGRVGSFDVLESMGIEIEKSGKELQEIYKKTGLAFIFARSFHPVMKHFAEARRVIGKPTIFNILGPLISPAKPKFQVIGTSFRGQMRMIAEACRMLGRKKVMVVCGSDGLDEVTLSGETFVVELNNGKIKEYKIKPEDFGVERASFKEFSGGDLDKNTEIAMKILSGEAVGRRADLVRINVSLALKLMGKVANLPDGYKMAKNVLGLPKFQAYKGDILGQITAAKILKKSDRNFYDALKNKKDGKALIAEIKQFSPSEGKIVRGKFSPKKIAKIYEASGASAISVVTEEKYFHGSFEYLKEVKMACGLPILCKDFVIYEYQIYKAREYGANAVLLIAAVLSEEVLRKFIGAVESLGMDALVEIHDEEELQKALNAGAKIIGINNRNLKTFEIDLNTTNRLVKLIPKDKTIVSESGIAGGRDVKKLDKRVNAILVGTSLMRSKNIKKLIHEIT
ncbi:MAG: anthranilate phosphoribosyltransferase [Patescibacteria group bacterium]